MTKNKRLVTVLYKLAEDEESLTGDRLKAAELLCRVHGFMAPSEPLPSFAGRPAKPETVDEKIQSLDLESSRHLLPKGD